MQGNLVVKRADLSAVLFYLAFVMMEICTWLLVVLNKTIFYYTKIFTVFMYITSFLFGKWNIKRICLLILFFVVSIISFVKTKDTQIYYLIVAIFSANKINSKTLAKIDLRVKCICFLIVFTLSFFNVIPYYSFITSTGRTVYSFGYFNPNSLFFGTFICCVDVILIKNKKIRKYDYLLLWIIGMIAGNITNCRTGMVAITILLMFLFLDNKYLLSNKKAYKNMIVAAMPFLFLISVFLIFYYDKQISVINYIDKAISGRIYFARRFYDIYKFSFFGQSVTTVTGLESLLTGQAAMPVDNFYIYSLVANGVLFSVFISAMYCRSEKNMLSKNMNIMAIILFVMALYSFAERVFLSFETNYLLILLGYGLNNDSVFIDKYITEQQYERLEKNGKEKLYL